MIVSVSILNSEDDEDSGNNDILLHYFSFSSVSRNSHLAPLLVTSSLNAAVETGMLQCRKHAPVTKHYILAILPSSINLALVF